MAEEQEHAAAMSNRVTVVDGNALAGPLAALFAVDATLLRVTCGCCGATGELATTIVEMDDAAAIARCRACRHTLLTVLNENGIPVLRLAAVTRITGPAADYPG